MDPCDLDRVHVNACRRQAGWPQGVQGTNPDKPRTLGLIEGLHPPTGAQEMGGGEGQVTHPLEDPTRQMWNVDKRSGFLHQKSRGERRRATQRADPQGVTPAGGRLRRHGVGVGVSAAWRRGPRTPLCSLGRGAWAGLTLALHLSGCFVCFPLTIDTHFSSNSYSGKRKPTEKLGESREHLSAFTWARGQLQWGTHTLPDPGVHLGSTLTLLPKHCPSGREHPPRDHRTAATPEQRAWGSPTS